MRKLFTLLSACFVTHITTAQIFSDDFESYNLGALCPQSTQWTTWSGNQGGTEDGTVTTAQANSGTKSVYLNSTSANGGPQDILLLLGQQYLTGIVTVEFSMYIPSGKQAYFNFQGNMTAGQVWSMNFNAANGTFAFDDGVTSNLLTSTYPSNTWFKMKVKANLTLGLWEAFVDDASIGTWMNSVNKIASVNFYPHNASASFYIDDVSFDHETYSLPTLNAIASMLQMNGNIATQVVNPSGKILNGGQNSITSFDATLNYNGNNYVQNITGISLASLASYTVNFGNVTLAPGANTATLTISNINGGNDNDPADNVLSISVNPVVPAPGKMVVGEEGTGTWCQWCPRGAIYMDKFEQEFEGFWAGIAVHNNDPMTVATYDAGLGQMVSGYPSAVVDRTASVDPSNMYNNFYARLQIPPVALISTNHTFDSGTRVLTVNVVANFQANATNAYKLACVLTEDGVTGTGSGWSQSNAYAGGNNGVMGGYELLPNPVPASQMVYDHVARAIEPSFGGDATSFPATVSTGETHSKTYTFTLPASWNENKMSIIGMIIAPDGKIDNASKFKLTSSANLSEQDMLNTQVSVYPNPSSTTTNVSLSLDQATSVDIQLVDVQGKVISSRNYGVMQGNQNIEMNTQLLNAGVYFVQINMSGAKITRKLIVQ